MYLKCMYIVLLVQFRMHFPIIVFKRTESVINFTISSSYLSYICINDRIVWTSFHKRHKSNLFANVCLHSVIVLDSHLWFYNRQTNDQTYISFPNKISNYDFNNWVQQLCKCLFEFDVSIDLANLKRFACIASHRITTRGWGFPKVFHSREKRKWNCRSREFGGYILPNYFKLNLYVQIYFYRRLSNT